MWLTVVDFQVACKNCWQRLNTLVSDSPALSMENVLYKEVWMVYGLFERILQKSTLNPTQILCKSHV